MGPAQPVAVRPRRHGPHATVYLIITWLRINIRLSMQPSNVLHRRSPSPVSFLWSGPSPPMAGHCHHSHCPLCSETSGVPRLPEHFLTTKLG